MFPLSGKNKKNQSVFSLSDQLEMFKEYIGKLKGMVGEERTNTILSKSLFFVVQGSNDITSTYFDIRRGQYDFASYADLLVIWASSFFKVLSIAMLFQFQFQFLTYNYLIIILYKANFKGIVWIGGTKNRCFQCASVRVPAITENLSRRDTERVCREVQRSIPVIQH